MDSELSNLGVIWHRSTTSLHGSHQLKVNTGEKSMAQDQSFALKLFLFL